jgi:hypothetical protein
MNTGILNFLCVYFKTNIITSIKEKIFVILCDIYISTQQLNTSEVRS